MLRIIKFILHLNLISKSWYFPFSVDILLLFIRFRRIKNFLCWAQGSSSSERRLIVEYNKKKLRLKNRTCVLLDEGEHKHLRKKSLEKITRAKQRRTFEYKIIFYTFVNWNDCDDLNWQQNGLTYVLSLIRSVASVFTYNWNLHIYKSQLNSQIARNEWVSECGMIRSIIKNIQKNGVMEKNSNLKMLDNMNDIAQHRCFWLDKNDLKKLFKLLKIHRGLILLNPLYSLRFVVK